MAEAWRSEGEMSSPRRRSRMFCTAEEVALRDHLRDKENLRRIRSGTQGCGRDRRQKSKAEGESAGEYSGRAWLRVRRQGAKVEGSQITVGRREKSSQSSEIEICT